MTDLPIPVDLHAGGVLRDYTGIFADLRRLIPHYTPEWTQNQDDDFGITLLQLQSYLSDHLNYRADSVQRDMRQAKTPHYFLLREYAEWMGCHALRPSAAQVDVTLSVAEALAAAVPVDIGFAAGVQIGTRTLRYEALSEFVIPVGGSISLTLTEGSTTLAYPMGSAQGKPFEALTLPVANVLFNWQETEDRFAVYLNGEEWTHSQWMVGAGPADKVFFVRVLRSGYLQVWFGDGTHGAIPPQGASVTCDFRTGGGAQGRIPRGCTWAALTSLNVNGVPLTVSLANTNPSIGGDDSEPIERLRQRAPAFFRRQNRAVTLEDYENVVLSVPGVYRVKILSTGVNGILIYVVPAGVSEGATLTAALKAAIFNAVDAQRMATDVPAIREAILVPIDVNILGTATARARNAELQARMYSALTDEAAGILTFANNNLGQRLYLSDMVGAMEDLPGLDHVDVNRYSRRPQLRWEQRLGNAALWDSGVVINAVTVEQTWHVRFLDPTTFSVRGSIYGLQQQAGTLGVTYTDDRGEIAFRLNAGALPMVAGDRAKFLVGKLAWNIQLEAFEFPVAGELLVRATGGIG